jgi:hypothetical protein
MERIVKRYVGVRSRVSEQFGATEVDDMNLFGRIVHTHG